MPTPSTAMLMPKEYGIMLRIKLKLLKSSKENMLVTIKKDLQQHYGHQGMQYKSQSHKIQSTIQKVESKLSKHVKFETIASGCLYQQKTRIFQTRFIAEKGSDKDFALFNPDHESTKTSGTFPR